MEVKVVPVAGVLVEITGEVLGVGVVDMAVEQPMAQNQKQQLLDLQC